MTTITEVININLPVTFILTKEQKETRDNPRYPAQIISFSWDDFELKTLISEGIWKYIEKKEK